MKTLAPSGLNDDSDFDLPFLMMRTIISFIPVYLLYKLYFYVFVFRACLYIHIGVFYGRFDHYNIEIIILIS